MDRLTAVLPLPDFLFVSKKIEAALDASLIFLSFFSVILAKCAVYYNNYNNVVQWSGYMYDNMMPRVYAN